MNFWCICLITLFFDTSVNVFAQSERPVIYMLPGQGADARLFSKIDLPDHKVVDIIYHIPSDDVTMKEYAEELSKQIDTSEKFILVGVSMGGMLSSEMADFLSPEKVILISSAKDNNELPSRYNFQKKLPLYKLVSGRLSKIGAQIMQPIVEPDRKVEKEIFKSMLKAKDEEFMKNSIRMIIEWEKEDHDESIIHIHGDNDHTIPFKNIDCDYVVKDGSHMIALTKPKKITELILQIINEN